ncbi:ATP-binding protein [Sphaerimonospora cavernae]|uniref:ATP-binding protein n=1 Tax=Sphaerimonospora cavernae TaxID=1740611 RepID=A0ABV6U4U2_9ACTN
MTNIQIMDRAADAVAPSLAREYTSPVPHVLQAASVMRHRVQGVLAAWGMPKTAAQEALLVISELVTEGILRGLPPVELRLSLRRDGVRTVMRVEVSDSGAALAPAWPVRVPRPDEHGCGSAVVKALAVRYGTDSRSGTVTRWADLPAF